MDQLKKLLAALSLSQKITIGVVAALVIGLLYGLTHWLHERDFKPLYTGIAPEEAGAVIQKIKESGSEYRLSDTGGVISVPASKVAELRLELASAGLPKSGRIGFELFDKTSFGATEFVEHINYNRALEGELERSVESLNAVETARVHITPAKDSVFVESREPGKASVVVRLRAGSMLFAPNVAAIQQMVSSAVDGVNPEDVSVVDTRGTLLSRRKVAHDDATDAAYSYRELLEHDMVAKIDGTLEPLLGHDHFHADVAVECDLATTDQDEDTVDPAKSVMLSSQKTEEVAAGGSTAGIPGTAANLPRPPARNGGPTSSTSRRTENITYQSSHTVRKTHMPEGQIKRVTVAVLLDQKPEWQGKGAARKLVPVPASQETLKAVHDLVAGVTGFSQERGDQITVESLPFQSEADQNGGNVSAPAVDKPINWKDWKGLMHNTMVMAAAGGCVFVLLLFGAAVMLFMRRRTKASGAELAHAALSAAAAEAQAKAALESATAADKVEAALANRAAEQERADLAALAALKVPTVSTKKTDLLTRELRETTKKDATTPAHVLQSWLHER